MFSRATSATARRLLTASHRPANVAAATGTSAPKTSLIDTHRRSLNVASKPSDLVGNTPLIDLSKILVAHGVDGEK